MKCPDEIHKYRRFRRNPGDPARKSITFRCIRCSHYVTRDFVIGRKAECWYCRKTFTMSEKSLQLKPHCGCRNNKEVQETAISLGLNKAPDKNELVDILMTKLGSK